MAVSRKNDDDDVLKTDKARSESSGVTAGTAKEDLVDANDDDAVLQALHNGRRDLIDPSQMTLERRMRFGLLTREDDEARVRGELGDHMTTHDERAVKRSNVFESTPGSEAKPKTE